MFIRMCFAYTILSLSLSLFQVLLLGTDLSFCLSDTFPDYISPPLSVSLSLFLTKSFSFFLVGKK